MVEGVLNIPPASNKVNKNMKLFNVEPNKFSDRPCMTFTPSTIIMVRLFAISVKIKKLEN